MESMRYSEGARGIEWLFLFPSIEKGSNDVPNNILASIVLGLNLVSD